MTQLGVDSVSGSSSDIRNDAPVLSGDSIDEGGFSGVGLADHRHPNVLKAFLLFRFLGKMLKHRVQQIAGAVAVD